MRSGMRVCAGQGDPSQDDLAAQMEAAAEQLAAAKRERETRRREEAISQVHSCSSREPAMGGTRPIRRPERWNPCGALLWLSVTHGPIARSPSVLSTASVALRFTHECQICASGQVEMVLQTYYHNLDNTYNKLQTINEYMDDVEVGGSPV